ncbi:MAG: Fic family protein [Bacilli bacterium]|nr:Fic family protein [Bacilli bacterium]
METKLLLEDKLSVGSKNLREIYEIVNHNKAWNYVKNKVSSNEELDENKIKDIHNLLMSDIIIGGIYRRVEVQISRASHTPPSPRDAFYQLQDFYQSLKDNNYNDFEIAAYTHAEFVRIHPFEVGNGRTSRIIMNYQLIYNGYLPISIKTC